jgi:hypothetical protein
VASAGEGKENTINRIAIKIEERVRIVYCPFWYFIFANSKVRENGKATYNQNDKRHKIIYIPHTIVLNAGTPRSWGK